MILSDMIGSLTSCHRDHGAAGTNSSSRLAPSIGGLLGEETVLDAVTSYQHDRRRFCLATLVGVEGGSPRPVGAQMAICEDGRYHGYLSGGCLEQTVILEAQAAIADQRNRLVRYGKGSPYFDVRLPCGSGLDIYFDTNLNSALIDEILAHHARRQPFEVETNLDTGKSCVVAPGCGTPGHGERQDGLFRRAYLPRLRMLLLGSGPAVAAIHYLASAIGMQVVTWVGDEATRRELDRRSICYARDIDPAISIRASADSFTAAVIAFHDHDREPEILATLLARDCFYVGVLGSTKVHELRLERLRQLGVSQSKLSGIKAPIGAIAGAKSNATLATGVLAEVLTEAKSRGMVG